ncbi:hypothetical protein QNI16_02920 [Cytophagaceae bacterium YF14B1]|uniref:Uncharacterized protein n=1 Tax=Xanthocytophaga flava TaxID=3048013 RepID=A0AAE3QL01_9BACT|nr:hypothetical protein [Xanthocytophaga flavus]MDJ1479420.1 hypothetical protein [Xanthocytophaga flavus]
MKQLNTPYFYILFTYPNKESFTSLQQIFRQLQHTKSLTDKINFPEDDEDESKDREIIIPTVDWNNYLTPSAKQWFTNTFDFQSEEGKVYLRLWDLTSVAIRSYNTFFIPPGNWSLESVIESILACEYTLVALEQLETTKAMLYYDPWGAPFGGVESLWQLIWAFDCQIVYDFYLGGVPSAEESTWNYDLAKQLVEQNKGLSN